MSAVPRGKEPGALASMALVHADWSVSPKGRWWAGGEPLGPGRWRLCGPLPVGDPATFPAALARRFDAAVLLGLDFPIGLPAAYARRAGVRHFPSFLAGLAAAGFGDFGQPAAQPGEIGIGRPFYPARPGGSSRSYLVEGLGVESYADLLRVCDRRSADRSEACALFWTLGGNQVGRAALAGWRELIAPLFLSAGSDFALWPFEGRLEQLASRARWVLAETYPAGAAVQLGLTAPGHGWSKRKREHRRPRAQAVAERARARGWELDARLAAAIEGGFGPEHGGDDGFDAFLGVVAMAEVAAGLHGEAPELAGDSLGVEGWILGYMP